MKGWDENQLGRPWNPNERLLFSHLVFEGFDPSFGSAIGTGRGRKRVIDQLHLDSVITSERSYTRGSAPRDVHRTTLFRCAVPLRALVLLIRVTV